MRRVLSREICPPAARPRRPSWRHGLGLLVVLGALATAAPAAALEFRTGGVVTVPAGTVVDDDLFAAGQSVTVAGQVNGDLYAFGQTVTVTGTVERDLLAAGQQITVDGVVNGDVRAAAQSVVINGRVEGNVTAAGQLLLLDQRGQVGGSVVGVGQTLNLLGSVGRGVTAGAETLHLGGLVGGNVTADVGTLTLDPSARIAGRLSYTAEREAAVPAGTVAGSVQFRPTERAERPPPPAPLLGGLFTPFGVIWLIGMLIAGVLLVYFLPEFAMGAARQVQAHPWRSVGVGLLAFFGGPVLVLLLAVTLIGLPLAVLVGLGYFLGLYVGWLLLGLAVGSLLALLARRWRPVAPLGPAWLVVIGLVVLYLLSHLPGIGWLVVFLGLCFGLGALLGQLVAARVARRPAPAPPPAAPSA
jgi:cytoskeletal protein CcmA (bactofilin family)